MRREPVITAASISAAASAIITLLVAFGLPLTDQQTAAVMGVVAIVGTLVPALISRQVVTPVQPDVLPADDVVGESATDGTVGMDEHDYSLGGTDPGYHPQPRRSIDDDGDGAPDLA